MTENEKQPTDKFGISIDIGGSVGPASAVGKDNRVTAHNVAGGNIVLGPNANSSDREKFIKVIKELQTRVNQLENQFDTEDVDDVQGRLEKVVQLSTREKPPTERIKRDLETVREIIKETAATGAAVAPILPLIQQVWEMFIHLFGL